MTFLAELARWSTFTALIAIGVDFIVSVRFRMRHFLLTIREASQPGQAWSFNQGVPGTVSVVRAFESGDCCVRGQPQCFLHGVPLLLGQYAVVMQQAYRLQGFIRRRDPETDADVGAHGLQSINDDLESGESTLVYSYCRHFFQFLNRCRYLLFFVCHKFMFVTRH